MTPPDPALPGQLLARLDRLAAVLAADPEALGLLALGSVGVETARLDAWSDLDFFAVVQPQAKARYIDDLGWLAQAHPLVWSFRNTADGHKALMADGVYCEFAVFAPAELARVPYAPGRWVWRREGLEAAASRPAVPLPAPRDAVWLLGEALSNLLVGLLRHGRGEHLAGLRLVQVCAVDRLLELVQAGGAAPGDGSPAAAADPFAPDRRIEARWGDAAARLPVWCAGYGGTVDAALDMLAWLEARHPVPPAVAARIRTLAAAAR